jgi:endo-1,4-beta-xylanase
MRLLVSMSVVLLFACRLALAVQDVAPAQGTPTFVASRMSDFRLLGQGAKAEYSSAVVEGQSFDWAIRVRVAARTTPVYDVQFLSPPTTVPLKKGEHILVTMSVRCTDAPNGIGVFDARIQAGAPSWAGIGSTDVAVGKEWKRIYIHGQAQQDFEAGKYDLSLQLGTQAQTIEIGGITMVNLGKNVDVCKLPFTPITYPGQKPDAPWRKAASERIDKHRKANLTVRVVNKNGQPMPGAQVHVQMQRHTFGFGTFLECKTMTGAGPDADKLRQWTLKLFNRCTTPIYWADWGWANPNSRKAYLECAKWAQDNNLATRGHCIIYPGWKFLPAAVRPLEKDPAALRARLLEQVAEVTEATRLFHFTEYDVCNELRDLPEIHKLLGRDVVAEWFRVAREHAPNSRMAINENTILTRGGVTQSEQDNYAEWIQYLVNQGQGPDVIGLQGHFGEAVTGPETVLHILDRFAAFGKAIQITEFDLITRDEQGQADYTRDFLTAVFSHPATDAFTMWGFWEGQMWQPPGAMIRKDWTLKPNGQAWMDLTLKEWWTDVHAFVGPDGSCSTRGFLGDYRVTATVGGKETSTLVKLTRPGNAITLTVD